MRILITNDDGIEASGLKVLREIAAELSDNVWTVAPETDHSGAGHSMSLRNPVRMRKIDEQTYAVNGTPTDCVVMAVRHVMFDNPPDLVLSGVNIGQNLAEDVTYSGTIAAAFEGTLMGIRSIALSQAFNFRSGCEPCWETAKHFAANLVRQLLVPSWPENVLMNINFPNCLPDDLKGVLITEQGRRNRSALPVKELEDTWGRPYYWLGFAREVSRPEKDTDLWAVHNGCVSITPLSVDLTAGDTIRMLQKIKLTHK
ncbi:MAG: 5'/3'-nucleotidase SurE [Hyphomicrobiaceae bacterium]|nr:5'/3'-nucleotidase SurE [Hyphomicrobiaceae bacterium]